MFGTNKVAFFFLKIMNSLIFIRDIVKKSTILLRHYSRFYMYMYIIISAVIPSVVNSCRLYTGNPVTFMPPLFLIILY